MAVKIKFISMNMLYDYRPFYFTDAILPAYCIVARRKKKKTKILRPIWLCICTIISYNNLFHIYEPISSVDQHAGRSIKIYKSTKSLKNINGSGQYRCIYIFLKLNNNTFKKKSTYFHFLRIEPAIYNTISSNRIKIKFERKEEPYKETKHWKASISIHSCIHHTHIHHLA